MLEQVLALGLLALILLVVSWLATSTIRSGRHTRQLGAANALAQDLLDERMTTSVEDLILGAQPPVSGSFPDGTPYTAVAEIYGLAAAGLTDSDIKRIRVSVQWKEPQGVSTVQAETCVARISR